MSVKDTARRQYERLVDTTAVQLADIATPREGWLATVRKALSMSGAQLARRTGVTKAAIYQAERQEADGGISLRQMQKLAEGMGCRFVYAIVPETKIADVVREQALAEAERIVKRTSAHMALEQQALPPHQLKEQIERLANELMRDMPSDFWEVR
jgi:predicted DNA-binding mobile mystery protein A